MKILQKCLVIMLICGLGNSAWAAKQVNVSTGNKTGYAGDPIMIANWPELQEKLKDAYGTDIFVAKDATEMQGFVDDSSPKAYTLDLNSVDIFSIINQPVPENIQAIVLGIFSDLKNTDFEAYDKGMTLFAQDNKKGAHTLVAVLLKAREQSEAASSGANLISFAIDEKLNIQFPAGSEIVSETKSTLGAISTESFSAEVPLIVKEAATNVATQLIKAKVPFNEINTEATSSISLTQEGARITITIVTLDEDEKTSLVHVIVHRQI